MSTTRRCLKSPRSLSGTSAHPTMVTRANIMARDGCLTSFSFHVNQRSHSWDKAISDSGQSRIVNPVSYLFASFSFHINLANNSWYRYFEFDLETSKSRSWVRSKVKDTYYAQYPTNPLHFRFTSIGPTSPEKKKTRLTLKKNYPTFLKNICQKNNFQQYLYGCKRSYADGRHILWNPDYNIFQSVFIHMRQKPNRVTWLIRRLVSWKRDYWLWRYLPGSEWAQDSHARKPPI